MSLNDPTVMVAPPSLRWREGFAALGPAFHTRLDPLPLPDPHWVARSADLADELGIAPDWLQGEEALAALSGNTVLEGMRPLASVYSGHQFGIWAGQLGDGRAHWLGEIESPAGPMEIQLKGSGRTPYSRMGDGRAVLRSSIREFLCSEAMHGLGIPTTRALCVTGSALPVRRETVETAAVVTRVAPSFIRFGHFEHFAHHDQHAALARLVAYVIERHYPQCDDAAGLLEAVALRTAELVAQWQAVGFCHGVMNTDNMSILGLTIDYGPFGFLDGFDPGHVCNHSDHEGRYAYARQPQVALWNLHALAQALLPLLGEPEAATERALAALEPYRDAFPAAWTARMLAKLGLAGGDAAARSLVDGLFAGMAEDRADMTITLRRLADFECAAGARNDALRDCFIDRAAFDAWAEGYGERLR
ncbi:MAG TPA: YdiU family protein, partial [Burkholderiaceae bacterium]|nr:YdiU family protein [Burkholderiaceae bacterium]